MDSTENKRECSCKGIRTCLICENEATKVVKKPLTDQYKEYGRCYAYCQVCRLAWPGWDVWTLSCTHSRPIEEEAHLSISDVELILDFVTEEEEAALVLAIDALPWVSSQSGRRKQDYGPKVNFKKRRVRVDAFLGFPSLARSLVERLEALIPDFRPVELCHLEYDPKRGAAIDPHKDDAWLWGERLVTLNLGARTVLTLALDRDAGDSMRWTVVRVPLPRRSLLVLAGAARHGWQHGVLREDVADRRVAMTFRELSPEFLPGGLQEDLGRTLLQQARVYL